MSSHDDVAAGVDGCAIVRIVCALMMMVRQRIENQVECRQMN